MQHFIILSDTFKVVFLFSYRCKGSQDNARNIRTIKIGISFIIYGFRYGIDGEKEPKVSMPFTSTYTWDEQKPHCIARGSFKNHVCEISSTRAEQLKLLQ